MEPLRAKTFVRAKKMPALQAIGRAALIQSKVTAV